MRLPVELIAAGVLLAGCAAVPPPSRADRAPPPLHRPPVSDVVKIGKTYEAGGQRHTPRDDRDLDQSGLASWYGEELRGRRTANGEAFDPEGFTAAHRTLPMPSYVEVTSRETGHAILVRVNDRGPFHGNRIIDLSLGAARLLGITGRGAHPVRVRRVEPRESERAALRQGRAVVIAQGERVVRAVPSPVPPGGEGPFFLQVASFHSEARAEALADRLDARVTQINGTYRVRLGPFRTAERARAALVPLAAKGYPDAQITR